MSNNKQSRKTLTLGAVALIIAGGVYAFWPKPTYVDMGTVARGHMMLTINEEARTRVRNIYTVSAPVSGHLLRVDAESNDLVKQGETVIARMLPANPTTLDAREHEQAVTAIQAAKASLDVAQANLKKAIANQTFEALNIKRAIKTRETGTISQAEFEQVQWRAADAAAAVDNAKAAISQRQAELANAQAALIGVEHQGIGLADTVEIKAPINGRVLQVLQKSEVILTAGTPIIELGDVGEDLEIIVQLLSTDAVKISEGDKVFVRNWGKAEPLSGVVERIEPFGYTKFSALGVEEQRVNAIIQLNEDDRARAKLGHGFRVEVQVVIWENQDTVIVPSSALFRKNGQWAVFVVENEKAKLTEVEIDRNNGTQASVTKHLSVDDRVVLYPASELANGAHVVNRRPNDQL